MSNEMTYEEARAELVDCVKKLEAGVPTLEESLELWERGEKLADLCSDYLAGARRRLSERMESDTDSEADEEE
ncbi:exodeoxyribonuclease VII small subunit [Haloglycomyces albus]|uniref:exodeoxyribonuclease VII small subunit n=1 Tax=Haloglycomyces albus TaxID=526067 RepID=UPI00046D244A|nr:exodeoxyribonuclease VII small subunit [Haloglycomyces albus]